MGSPKDDPPTLQYSQRPRAGSIIVDDRTTTAGPYAIGDVIGRGGGGEVLLAHDRRIGRDVALKRLRSASPDEEEIGRFLREARIQARLEHPAIVPVYELGRDELGRPFFAMKRLAGKTLSEVLGVATRERMLRAFADVCRAIDYAHSRGIVHRDLKPANIVLGEFGEVYVIDWGVARVIGDAVLMPDVDTIEGTTESGQKLGTPKYMAPEQAENPEVDRPADIYSLGVILSEILGRERPLELDALCTTMLSRDPAKRPTARECADRIEQYLDGDRDLARRKALAEELVTFARAALGRNQRTDALRAASQALALDPRAPGAGELVTTLMLEPPPVPPPALVAAFDAADAADVSRHAKAAIPGYLLIAAFIPAVVFTKVIHWAAVIATAVAALVMAIAAFRLARLPERSFRWMVAYGIGNALIMVMLGMLVTPFMVVPAVASFVTASVITYPAFLQRPVVLVVTMVIGWLAPLAVPGAWSIGADGLLLRGNAVALGSTATVVIASLSPAMPSIAITAFAVRKRLSSRCSSRCSIARPTAISSASTFTGFVM
jgi:serine/threonine-protein kinase